MFVYKYDINIYKKCPYIHMYLIFSCYNQLVLTTYKSTSTPIKNPPTATTVTTCTTEPATTGDFSNKASLIRRGGICIVVDADDETANGNAAKKIVDGKRSSKRRIKFSGRSKNSNTKCQTKTCQLCGTALKSDTNDRKLNQITRQQYFLLFWLRINRKQQLQQHQHEQQHLQQQQQNGCKCGALGELRPF